MALVIITHTITGTGIIATGTMTATIQEIGVIIEMIAGGMTAGGFEAGDW